MSSPVIEKGQVLTASNANLQCFTGPGECIGIFVSSASNTPLLTVSDASANVAGNSNAIVPQFVPVAATFYRIPAKVLTGLNVNNSGNVVYSVFFNKG